VKRVCVNPIVWGLLPVGLLTWAVVFGGYPLSMHVNYVSGSFDLHSGRWRATSYMFHIPVYRRTYETEFTRIADELCLYPGARWIWTSTKAPAFAPIILRRYFHCGATDLATQGKIVDWLFSEYGFTVDAKRKAVAALLAIWNQEDLLLARVSGWKYVDDLERIVLECAAANRAVTSGDVPDADTYLNSRL